MRAFSGKSYESRKYLNKRKLREQAFQRKIDEHLTAIYEMEAEDPKVRLANDERMKGYTFSDEEDEYNYYTDAEDEEYSEH
jgi:hypothetical protein